MADRVDSSGTARGEEAAAQESLDAARIGGDLGRPVADNVDSSEAH
jgi:hypothetical protein